MLEHPGRTDDVEGPRAKRQLLAGADNSMLDDAVAGEGGDIGIDSEDGGARRARSIVGTESVAASTEAEDAGSLRRRRPDERLVHANAVDP